jgi:eukaryotic-like serine/threonine-protein kinase
VAELGAALDEAVSGRGRLFVIAGEPGIGKTRLADEIAKHARARGALVLKGRSWEGGGAPPYWPWIQIVRSYVRQAAPDLTTVPASILTQIAEIVPELRERLPSLPSPPRLESAEARFALFDGLCAFLVGAGVSRPLFLVLDDLHAADPSSLLLLRFLSQELASSRLLVAGTYRDVEARLEPTVGSLLEEVARDARRIALGGLAKSEVAQFLEQGAGSPPNPETLNTIYAATEGNPLFLEEIVRLGARKSLDETKGVIADSVRHTIERRLRHLSAATIEILETAAAIGRDFDLALLERVCRVSEGDLLRILREAAAAGLVSESPGALRRASFAHALFRETLYDGLSPERRMNLHRAIAEALELLHQGTIVPDLARLAHHWCAAGSAGNAKKALDYAARAGDRAMMLLAYEEAIREYERALDVARSLPADRGRHCDLLLSLGEASWRSGNVPGAREIFSQATDIAREIGSSDQLGRAALGYGSGAQVQAFGYRADEVVIRRLEEAIASFGKDENPICVRVMARLALELHWTSEVERRDEMSRRAVELAERLSDAKLRATALYSRFMATHGAEDAGVRLSLAGEILRLAEQANDFEMIFWARSLRMGALVELGKMVEAVEELERCSALAEELRLPNLRWRVRYLRLGRLLSEGRLAEAERESLADLGQGKLPTDLTMQWYAVLTCSQFLQGRFDEVLGLIESVASQFPLILAPRVTLAFLFCEKNQLAEAREELERFAADDFEGAPRGPFRVFFLFIASLVCWILRDSRRAATLFALLAPNAERNVTMGNFMNFGSVSLALGMLAAAMERREEAGRRFAFALNWNRTIPNRPFLVITLREYARMLIAEGTVTAAERAVGLLDEALAIATQIGMDGFVSGIQHLRGQALGRLESVASLVKVGKTWRISCGREEARLGDLKGVRYIACLLGRPYEEVHVMELVAAAGGGTQIEVNAGVRSDLRASRRLASALGDAGAMLDGKAKVAYRERLVALREAQDEARMRGDALAEERAEEEIRALSRELAAAVGLGGRDRRAASVDDRARVSVTKAIQTAIRRIEPGCPSLGRHLAGSIRTGLFCSYSPDPNTPRFSWTL